MSQARDLIEKVASGQSPAQVVASKPLTEAAGFNLNDDPVDIAASLLDHGENHPALTAVKGLWHNLLEKIRTAKQHNDGVKRGGGGDISAPKFVTLEVLPALDQFAKTVQMVHDQLHTALHKH